MTSRRARGEAFTLRPAGPRAFLIEFADRDGVRDYYAEALRRRAAGTLAPSIEIVPAARTILFDDLDDAAETARQVRSWEPGRAPAPRPRRIDIPTVYDGPDLADVATLWAVTPAEAIARHADLRHEVAFIGFAPGFAYISGLPDELRVPRRDRPRTRVPAGSVGLADEFTGVYPRESPGGWQLIGRTDLPMWDPAADPPSRLMPGDIVRFVPTT